MSWRDEKGFTLIELTVVMAVMGVFIAAMTSTLMVAFDAHAEIVEENRERAGSSLVNQHLERIVRSADRENSFFLVDNPKDTVSNSDKKALCIQIPDTAYPGASPTYTYLYYYVDPDQKNMCFASSTGLDRNNVPSADDELMRIGSGITSAQWRIGDGYVECVMTTEPYEAGGTPGTETVRFALKTAQTSDSTTP